MLLFVKTKNIGHLFHDSALQTILYIAQKNDNKTADFALFSADLPVARKYCKNEGLFWAIIK